MSLRNVTLSIPEGGQEHAQLEEDLKKMSCMGLLKRPWGLKLEETMRKLLTKQPNIFNTTVQDRLQQWTSELWRKVYDFSDGGLRLANRMDAYVNSKFAHQVDPKDGYPVRDYRSARHYRLLEFIVPIIHLDKPIWVTIIIENIIFDALDRDRPIDLGVVFRGLAQRLVAGVGKPKPTQFALFSSTSTIARDC